MQIKHQSVDITVSADQFSSIELACLHHLAQGHSVDELCLALSLTPEAALSAITSAEIRLGARNRLHAIIMAIRLGLIEDVPE
ncbi:helix-turn-helix transcriptional regulator [Rhizobium sp. RU36D]|uniref:helix-turn-helix transcriptional regulator n=1 Tax=Rhizobium sp. RU36D TaxID=1907415 RepID=UPI0009D8B1F1|nr:helix-turn-helix transcriptional regulator [Rhizobium sp. RU36D]SMD17422.1 DNA-binding transcriptional regulator, CsgD family [Rhizobium sp. RU36D]